LCLRVKEKVKSPEGKGNLWSDYREEAYLRKHVKLFDELESAAT